VIDQVTNAFTTSVVDGTKSQKEVSTTNFTTDANVVSTTIANPRYTPRVLYTSATDNTEQDLKTFLAKPVICQSGVFSTTDSVSTFSAVHFPSFYNGVAMWKEKTNGFLGIRMDLSFRLVINANRFQQGRYMLMWLPTGGSASADARNVQIMNGHIMTLVQRSQMPHAEIDINCDTEIEFYIPYSSVYNFSHIRPINSGGGNTHTSLGSVRIFPYVPLAATSGPTTCAYTLYVSAQNVELLIATIPQSMRFNSKRKGRNESNVEQDQANIGPISGIMARVKDAASLLEDVPLISSYASTTRWFADVVGRTASVFGYTRPINLMPVQRVSKEVYPYIANHDGPDNSAPLSLSYKNELGQMDGCSPTDLDEMDFSFLCSIPTYQTTLSWSTATVSGTLLSGFNVAPSTDLFGSTTINALNYYHLPPYRFVAQQFKFWRGTMVYKFKFVKTEFHSGRLSFAFMPFVTSEIVPSNFNYTDAHYIHREVVDIREENEVIIKVPFVSDTPYRHYRDDGVSDICSTGRFCIHIVDALTAPATVPSTISIIVEVCMQNAEFAVPNDTILNTPIYNTTPQMADLTDNGLAEPNSCNELSTTIGCSTATTDGMISSLLCIGERISSLRALLRRPFPNLYVTAPTAATMLNLVPFAVSAQVQQGLATTTPSTLPDRYSIYSSLYMYSRGGVRIKFVDSYEPESTTGVLPALTFAKQRVLHILTTDTTDSLTYFIRNSNTNLQGSIYAYGTNWQNSITQVLSPDESQEVQIPHYHRFPLRNNFDHIATVDYPYLKYNNNLLPGTATEVYLTRTIAAPYLETNQLNSTARVYRSGADDCNFSYFLSVPPMGSFGAN